MTDFTILQELWDIIESRKNSPKEDSYTNLLLSDDTLILEKLKEELEEIIEASKANKIGSVDEKDSLVWETADFLYHLMVLLASKNVSLDTIMEELQKRRK
jgi:phosphoribosyl-ATP pyrophosphohydrolase